MNGDEATADGLLRAVSPRRAALDVLAQIVGQVLNLALGVVVTLIVVRSLGDTRFGEWSTILALIQIVGFFSNFGLENVAVRFAAGDPEHEREWIGGLVTFTAALTVPVAVVGAVVLQVLSRTPEMRTASLLMSLTLLVSALSTLSAVFRIRVENHLGVVFTTANSVLWGAAVILVSATGGGMVAFAAAFLATSLVVQGAQAFYALRVGAIPLRGTRSRWGPLARVGVAVGIGTLLTVAYGRIDQVLVFELAPHRAEAGFYGAIYRILDQAGFAPAAVMTTLFPLISSAHPTDMVRVRRMVQLAIENLAILSLPAFAFSLAAAGPMVRLLFGASFGPAAGGLPILMGAYIAICFGYIAGYMSIVTNLQRRFIAFASLGLVVNVALNLLLIPAHGFIGAAWVTLATEALVVGLELVAVLAAIELRPEPRRLLGAAVAAGISGTAVWVARGQGLPIGWLAVLMLLAYPALLLILRAVDLKELRALRG
jgi:O-antigen/teichoic acid export membrane protein